MRFSFSTLVYKLLIDPILSKLHDTILSNIEPTDRVIDVACGTGSQAISISEEMISEAQRASRLRGLKNVQFRIRDASDLSTFRDREFNIAVTSMAIHQFDADLAVKILCEMRRIALKTIIVDYNYPIPKGFSRSVVFAIERLAGGDHYRNFRLYMGNMGLRYFTNAAGLSILSSVVKGNGVFLIEVGT